MPDALVLIVHSILMRDTTLWNDFSSAVCPDAVVLIVHSILKTDKTLWNDFSSAVCPDAVVGSSLKTPLAESILSPCKFK